MYEQGDILLIPFPFSDLSSTKQRPVLVLSNSAYNGSQQDILVAGITSNLSDRTYLIHLTTNDLEQGQLKVDSGIRADKIYTLSKQIVVKKFGRVNQTIVSQVKEKINELLTD
ncbi:type II toxin-antitoxin system PemK/MazF family toxin [Paenibacillus oenotherae]|uniref:Type II toxin-antitoxin system PemK/MazF family toxin n=1 Tax=Paenibacillus oenotherae TaxID=1435645 RepID=A0ABS7D4D7_9BACL|nr:type II toxin-antitoxin system PemK/MazF family toxin [Paenibacillus oenotherae]MBW7474800.1 type II toxin-antitoxin system PemK/MazF family toxin [Paenibacillus oenotherae]